MMNEVLVFAPAKINIGLRVLPKRQDGFHNLESIFQTVSVADEIKVHAEDGEGICSVECADMILPEKNTLTMAYDEFYNATGLKKLNIKITLVKHIPAGGGLGGGSSDGAALLRALEKIHGIKLSEKQLDSIASKIGSDVFFFVHCGNKNGFCAVVTGRGENIREIRKRNDLFFVMIFPDVQSSTKEAYFLVDELIEKKDCNFYPPLEDLEEEYNSDVSKWSFKNTFTSALVLKFPEIGNAFEKLKKTKPVFSEMSGSGSTIFGIYASKAEAEKAAKILNDEGFKCVVTQ